MLVLATIELVAHDMHTYEMHAYMPVREAGRERHSHKEIRTRERRMLERCMPTRDACPARCEVTSGALTALPYLHTFHRY